MFFFVLFSFIITQSADSFQNLSKSRLWSFHEGWRTWNCFTNSHNGLASFPGHSQILSRSSRTLHSCEIKSGSGLQARVIIKYEGTEIEHKDYAFTMCGAHNWSCSQAFFSRNRRRNKPVTSMVNAVELVVSETGSAYQIVEHDITCTRANFLHTW